MIRPSESSWRWTICGLLLLATTLNYMDRQTLSQSATAVCNEFTLSNEDYGRLEESFGIAFAVGGLVIGAIADRVSLRWLYPSVLFGWSVAGFATGFARGYNELLVCRTLLGFFEAGQWPCALDASRRLLTRDDRTLGNSLIQSGASLGAIITPLIVQLMNSSATGAWRGPFQAIGALGLVWIAAWFIMVRPNDLANQPAETDKQNRAETTADSSQFFRRFVVLVVMVVAINLCWHFYRAWMPKMLRERYGYSAAFVNYFTSAYYVATDIGCLGAGWAIRRLVKSGNSLHQARVLTFLGCSLLTALGALIPFLPVPAVLPTVLLLLGAGVLGLFPIYYSLSQELSTRHQGKVIGALAFIAWITVAPMQRQIGRWVDQTGSYRNALIFTGLCPIVALAVFALAWNRRRLPQSHGLGFVDS